MALATTLTAGCGTETSPPPPSPSEAVPVVVPGQIAPDFTLPQASGGRVRLSDLRGRPVLLYFSMDPGWPGCMQQVVDLQRDKGFRSTGAELLSVAMDPPEAWKEAGDDLGVKVPMLSDAANRVATEYGIMRWAMAGAEPGHTFALVDADGRVAWVRNYGAPENGGAMYVSPADVTDQVRSALA